MQVLLQFYFHLCYPLFLFLLFTTAITTVLDIFS